MLKKLIMTGAAIVLATGGAFADTFPSKPIEFIIPFGAGGGADIEGRLLAKEMGKVLGVSVVPINKPGAGGAVTYTYVKNAKPDGYTIAWSSTSVLTTTNIGNVPFKHDALDHLGRVEYQPMPFVVKATAPWKTFNEFAKDCKANPGKYKIAVSSAGSGTHVAAIDLMTASDCKVTYLPVGVKRRNATVLSGEADGMTAPLTASIRLSKAGKLRILAIPSEKRNDFIPDVPTAKELGYDAQLDLFRALAVPKGTPAAIKAKLYDAMVKAANSAAFKDLSKKKGFTIATMGIEEFDEMVVAEDKRVQKIMKTAGLYQSKSKQ